MDPLGKVFVATLKEGICEDCTVLAGKVNLEFEDGRPADIGGGVQPKDLRGVHCVDSISGLPSSSPHGGQVEAGSRFRIILSLRR
jgi:hypothetical protein